MNTRISIRNRIYSKAAVSDINTMYFHQEINSDDAAQLLKAVHKDFLNFVNKGIFELVPCSRLP